MLGNLDIELTLDAIEDRFNRSSWSEYSDFNDRCEVKWFVNWIAVFRDKSFKSSLADDTTALQGSIIHRLIDLIYNERVYLRPSLIEAEKFYQWLSHQVSLMLDMIVYPIEAQNEDPFAEYFRVNSTRSNRYFIETEHGKGVAEQFLSKGLEPDLVNDLSPCFVNLEELSARYSGVDGLKDSIPKLVYKSLVNLTGVHPPQKTLVESKWFYCIEDGTEEGTKIKAIIDFLSVVDGEIPESTRIAKDEDRRLPEGKGGFNLTDGKTRYWKRYTKVGQLQIYAYIVKKVSGWTPKKLQFFDFTNQKYISFDYDERMDSLLPEYARKRKETLSDLREVLVRASKQGHDQIPMEFLGMSLRPSKSRCKFCKAVACPKRSVAKPYMVSSFGISQQFSNADVGEVSL